MRRTETLFLICVLAVAALFAGMSLRTTSRILETRSSEAAAGGAAGRARDVDLELIERMIQSGDLSPHEAEFYKQAPGTEVDEQPAVKPAKRPR